MFYKGKDEPVNVVSRCDLIQSLIPPAVENLEKIQVNANSAYVVYEEQLFYINKKKRICHQIPITDKQGLANLNAKVECQTLSKDVLKNITSMTGYIPEETSKILNLVLMIAQSKKLPLILQSLQVEDENTKRLNENLDKLVAFVIESVFSSFFNEIVGLRKDLKPYLGDDSIDPTVLKKVNKFKQKMPVSLEMLGIRLFHNLFRNKTPIVSSIKAKLEQRKIDEKSRGEIDLILIKYLQEDAILTQDIDISAITPYIKNITSLSKDICEKNKLSGLQEASGAFDEILKKSLAINKDKLSSNEIEHFASIISAELNGRNLYIVPEQLPENLAGYEYSYILVKQFSSASLYYVQYDKKFEKIEDASLLAKMIPEIFKVAKPTDNKIRLSDQQITATKITHSNYKSTRENIVKAISTLDSIQPIYTLDRSDLGHFLDDPFYEVNYIYGNFKASSSNVFKTFGALSSTTNALDAISPLLDVAIENTAGNEELKANIIRYKRCFQSYFQIACRLVMPIEAFDSALVKLAHYWKDAELIGKIKMLQSKKATLKDKASLLEELKRVSEFIVEIGRLPPEKIHFQASYSGLFSELHAYLSQASQSDRTENYANFKGIYDYIKELSKKYGSNLIEISRNAAPPTKTQTLLLEIYNHYYKKILIGEKNKSIEFSDKLIPAPLLASELGTIFGFIKEIKACVPTKEFFLQRPHKDLLEKLSAYLSEIHAPGKISCYSHLQEISAHIKAVCEEQEFNLMTIAQNSAEPSKMQVLLLEIYDYYCEKIRTTRGAVSGIYNQKISSELLASELEKISKFMTALKELPTNEKFIFDWSLGALSHELSAYFSKMGATNQIDTHRNLQELYATVKKLCEQYNFNLMAISKNSKPPEEIQTLLLKIYSHYCDKIISAKQGSFEISSKIIPETVFAAEKKEMARFMKQIKALPSEKLPFQRLYSDLLENLFGYLSAIKKGNDQISYANLQGVSSRIKELCEEYAVDLLTICQTSDHSAKAQILLLKIFDYYRGKVISTSQTEAAKIYSQTISSELLLNERNMIDQFIQKIKNIPVLAAFSSSNKALLNDLALYLPTVQRKSIESYADLTTIYGEIRKLYKDRFNANTVRDADKRSKTESLLLEIHDYYSETIVLDSSIEERKTFNQKDSDEATAVKLAGSLSNIFLSNPDVAARKVLIPFTIYLEKNVTGHINEADIDYKGIFDELNRQLAEQKINIEQLKKSTGLTESQRLIITLYNHYEQIAQNNPYQDHQNEKQAKNAISSPNHSQ